MAAALKREHAVSEDETIPSANTIVAGNMSLMFEIAREAADAEEHRVGDIEELQDTDED